MKTKKNIKNYIICAGREENGREFRKNKTHETCNWEG